MDVDGHIKLPGTATTPSIGYTPTTTSGQDYIPTTLVDVGTPSTDTSAQDTGSSAQDTSNSDYAALFPDLELTAAADPGSDETVLGEGKEEGTDVSVQGGQQQGGECSVHHCAGCEQLAHIHVVVVCLSHIMCVCPCVLPGVSVTTGPLIYSVTYKILKSKGV